MNGEDISIDEEIKIFKTIKPVDIKNVFNLYFNNMCIVITGKHNYKILKNDIDKIMIWSKFIIFYPNLSFFIQILITSYCQLLKLIKHFVITSFKIIKTFYPNLSFF